MALNLYSLCIFKLVLRVLIILPLLMCSLCRGDILQLYDNPNLNGDNYVIPLNGMEGKCHDLPEKWTKKVSSLQLIKRTEIEICVDMFPERNCTGGNRVRIFPEGNGDKTIYKRLEEWNFDNMLVSFQVCNREKEEQEGNIIKLIKVEPKEGKETKVYLSIFDCKNIPDNWIGKFSRSHVFDSHTTCFQYFSRKNCTGNSSSNFGDNELNTKQYTAHGIPIPTNTKSISRCDYNANEISKPMHIIVIIIVSVIAVIFFLGIIFGIYKYQTAKKIYYERVVELEQQNEKFITDFLAGNPKAFEMVPYEHADANFRAQNAPYDSDKFEISYDSLEMEGNKVLGKGQQGIVLKAKLYSPKFPTSFYVAVKTVRTGSDAGYVKALLEECKIMMYLNSEGKHPHIVNLIGACTENLSKLEPYIIIEYCSEGSLHKFLRKRRKTFVNLLQKNGQLIPPGNECKDVSDKKVTNTIDLMKWSRDIADGMDYLAARKVCHGDLAARNILLDEKYNVKISDFGLSRQLYQYSLYVKKSKIPLPWRWMAVESIRDMKFSASSDVWAFGITLWEIFSLSETPYPGMEWNPLFIKSLKDGYRMSQPNYAPLGVYQLMLSCWEELPKDRPTFLDLKNELSATLFFCLGEDK